MEDCIELYVHGISKINYFGLYAYIDIYDED